MKQPMTKKEIEVWDAIANAYFSGFFADSGLTAIYPEGAYDFANKAIAARRAALIADAHVGFLAGCGGDIYWGCKCYSSLLGVSAGHAKEDDYCEVCHTRRPDAVYKVTSDKQDCSTCKYEQSEWSEEPCNNCEFMSRWEMPDAVQCEVPKQKFENDAGKACRNCKHKLIHWENEPCKSCDFSDNWEIHK
jgi:hypothetical protein